MRVPLKRLKKEADRINMRCRLDPVKLKALCKTGRIVDGKVGSIIFVKLISCRRFGAL